MHKTRRQPAFTAPLAAGSLNCPARITYANRSTRPRSDGRSLARSLVRSLARARTPAPLPCLPDFLPAAAVAEIQDPEALELLASLQRTDVEITAPSGEVVHVPTAYFQWMSRDNADSGATMVLIHGFDSSTMEFRRLIPKLIQQNALHRVLAVDVLGWGFTARPDGIGCGPLEKRIHLKAALDKLLPEWGPRTQVSMLGASLGAAIAIDFVTHYPGLVDRMVFIDGQAFLDAEKPPFSFDWLDRLGVKVLQSKPLRTFANNLSYFDQTTYRNRADFVRIGRLQCLMPGWADSQRLFIQSDKYSVSTLVSGLDLDQLLVIWGREDKILDVQNAHRFQQILGQEVCQVEIIPECGHVPAIEKPDVCVDLMQRYGAVFAASADAAKARGQPPQPAVVAASSVADQQ